MSLVKFRSLVAFALLMVSSASAQATPQSTEKSPVVDKSRKTASGPSTSSRPTGKQVQLQPVEFDAIAIASRQEIYALDERAIYPICVRVGGFKELPQALINSLHVHDVTASEKIAACLPKGGFPHGLIVEVNANRGTDGLNLHFESGDTTLGPARHFGKTLRRGTYHLKKDAKGEWQILGYDKEYDYQDGQNCDKSRRPE